MCLQHLLNHPIEEGEDDRPEERREDASDRKARHEPVHRVEEERIDDEREEPEGDDRQGEREHGEDRPHYHGEYRPHERDEKDIYPTTGNRNTGNDVGGEQDGSRRAEEAEDSVHGAMVAAPETWCNRGAAPEVPPVSYRQSLLLIHPIVSESCAFVAFGLFRFPLYFVVKNFIERIVAHFAIFILYLVCFVFIIGLHTWTAASL